MKKKLIFLLLIVLTIQTANAQNKQYSSFRMEITPFTSCILDKSPSWGGGLSIEPKWNITDHISAGIRISETFFGNRIGIGVGSSSAKVNINFSYMTSYGIVADYFFTTGYCRPFVNLGIRRYNYTGVGYKVHADTAANANVGINVRSAKKWGIEPQIGISFPGARLSVSYNYLFGGSDIIVNEQVMVNENGAAAGIVVKSNKISIDHFSFKLDITIAGRKKW